MKREVLNHLNNEYTEPVRDPVWRNIYLSRGLLRLLNEEPCQKLNRIKQLGPAHLVYPGATHTRLNHSLGVFGIAVRLIRHLLNYFPPNRLDVEDVKAFVTAALLHDLGHYPYAHSLKDLDVRSHESLTAEIICNEPFSRWLREYVGVEATYVAAIIDRNLSEGRFENLGFFRNLLSGVLDPDKLDYLSRDAYFCGVPYGIQDVDFVLGEIRPHGIDRFAVTEKGLTSVESVLFSKYLMYKTVYWHKTVRVATAMVKKALLLGIESGEIRKKDLYGLDDEEFFRLFDRSRYSGFGIITDVLNRKLFKTVFSIPFDERNKFHRALVGLENRLKEEREILREVYKLTGKHYRDEDVIIDIPEPISFEVELPVVKRDGNVVDFKHSSSVFTGDVVGKFVSSLRSVSVIVRRDRELMESVLEISKDRFLDVH